jgi:two-component system KDP operon response regulator KdpE
MSHILVVDDEPDLLRAMVLNLSNRGYQVSTADTGQAAVDQVTASSPDLVVLDLGLPDVDGLEVIRSLRREKPSLPIIVLSARSGSHDKVVALDLGAVDYVTKPFDMNEFLARLRAVARRTTSDKPPPIELGPLQVNLEARIVNRTGSQPPEAVHLTPTEWRILEILLRQPGRLVSAHELLTALRGDTEHTDSSYLRIYMAQLRRKLEASPSRPRYLITEPGMGYRYQP